MHSVLLFVAFVIRREDKHGGDVSFMNYKELEEAYAKQEVYPLDLKNAVAEELNKVSNSIVFTIISDNYIY